MASHRPTHALDILNLRYVPMAPAQRGRAAHARLRCPTFAYSLRPAQISVASVALPHLPVRPGANQGCRPLPWPGCRGRGDSYRASVCRQAVSARCGTGRAARRCGTNAGRTCDSVGSICRLGSPAYDAHGTAARRVRRCHHRRAGELVQARTGDPGATVPSLSLGDALYFSYATLTTIGSSNLMPATVQAKTLVWVEAIAGQIYIAVLIARLVSLQILHSTTNGRRQRTARSGRRAPVEQRSQALVTTRRLGSPSIRRSSRKRSQGR